MTITLHHLQTSRSQRIFWLLEELQLPYELKIQNLYTRDKNLLIAALRMWWCNLVDGMQKRFHGSAPGRRVPACLTTGYNH